MTRAPEPTAHQTMVVERMLELIDVRSPWHRSLWQLGTLHSIGEVLECTDSTWQGAIPNAEAQKYIVSRCKIQVMADIGIGAENVREAICEKLGMLQAKKSATQVALAHEIDELIARSRRDYLPRWLQEIETSGIATGKVEKTARLLVSHFLDEGFDQKHIHGWIKSSLAKSSEEILAGILKEGHLMCRQPAEKYEFAVPVQRGNSERNWHGTDTEFLDVEVTGRNFLTRASYPMIWNDFYFQIQRPS